MAGVTIALRWTCTVTDTDADSEEVAPVRVVEKTITGAEVLSPKRVQVQNTEATLWSAAGIGEPATSYQLAAIWTDVVVDLEFTVANGEGDENRFCLRLQPNAPLVLCDDASTEREAGGDAFAGVADDIDLIKIKERNNVLATVHALFVKP